MMRILKIHLATEMLDCTNFRWPRAKCANSNMKCKNTKIQKCRNTENAGEYYSVGEAA